MKLIARAKPIRIRIMSGGDEHFSLDSLRQNFCVQDIFPLIKDKRLSRWLRQQNEEELATSLDALGDMTLDATTYVEVLRLFFPKEKIDAEDIYKLYDYWHDHKPNSPKNYDYLRTYLLSTHNGIIYMIQNHREELSEEKLYDYLQKIEEIEGDAELLYLRGKMLYDGFEKDGKIVKDIFKASELIKKSADLDFKEAVDFVASHDFSLRKLSLLTPEEKNVIDLQIKKWQEDKLGYINNIRKTDSEIVRDVKQLLREFTTFKKAAFRVDGFYYCVRHTYFNRLKESDFFYKERRFLLELAINHFYPDFDLFTELANKYHYCLAEYMLAYKLNPTLKIEGKCFGRISCGDKLNFIVDHLFEY